MTESNDNKNPEPTEEDLRLARCWKPEFAKLEIPPDQIEAHAGWGMVDKQFQDGLKYSDYREYSAEELEAMDLASFQKTWQAVEVKLLRNPNVTEDEKRTYIDECFFFGGFRFSDAVYQQLDELKLKWHGDGIGTLEILEALRDHSQGRAATLIDEHIDESGTAEDYDSEGYPDADSPVYLTGGARRVFKNANRLMEESEDGWISNEHLLLALLTTEATNFQEHLERNDIRPSGLERTLRSYLGIVATRTLSDDLRAYKIYSNVERELKLLIEIELKRQHGDDWWEKGVPDHVKDECRYTRMKDELNLPEDRYLYIRHLNAIIRSYDNWRRFRPALFAATKKTTKDEATDWMWSLRRVRNVVMHPVKRHIRAEELEQIRNARRITSEFMARMGIRS